MSSMKIQKLLDELKALKKALLDNRDNPSNELVQNNLNDYVTLRSFDLISLQDELTSMGLSSLGRSQTCVMSSIDQNIQVLEKILNQKSQIDTNSYLDFKSAKKIQKEHTKVFGKVRDDIFKTKIMVTLPSQAAQSDELIKDLIDQDVSILRINTAHDDADIWSRMAHLIKKNNHKQKKDTKIYVDLAGPKNRTGALNKILTPFKIGSKKSAFEVDILSKTQKNSVTQKASVDMQGNKLNATLVVDDAFYKRSLKYNKIKLEDHTRDKVHTFKLYREDQRLFFIPDRKILIDQDTHLHSPKRKHSSSLHNFIYLDEVIRVFEQDEIILTHQDILGHTTFNYEQKEYAAIVACSNTEIFKYVNEGDTIFIDDGKIGAIVTQKLTIGLELKIILAKANGTLLKAQKGINFPNTDLDIPAITDEDRDNFDSVIEYADFIGISFTQSAKDIQVVQELLNRADKNKIAIVPKIETKLGVNNLPQILSQLIKREHFALMIARGDLAIEVGFDNLPYIQEEIFDICESALVPVIYATQILEGQMKRNLPTRAEVTDAAFAQRADCIMLNKGPYVVDTVLILKKILRSMHKLFAKNRQLLNVCTAWNINKNERIK
ncbi:MAG: pyruvate kinase [Campylobacterota bacterium]|nr:pyruvate kinase [Campylobacterota bacterium]